MNRAKSRTAELKGKRQLAQVRLLQLINLSHVLKNIKIIMRRERSGEEWQRSNTERKGREKRERQLAA